MKRGISILCAAGVVVLSLLVASPANAAQPSALAAPSVKPKPVAHTQIVNMPAPPNNVAAPMLAAQASPTISPANAFPGTDYYFLAPGVGAMTCWSGTFCPAVWDPNVGKWKVFKMYYCHTYTLGNWFGSGFYWDTQSAGTQTFFYGQGFSYITSFYAPTGVESYSSWTPVYYISNC